MSQGTAILQNEPGIQLNGIDAEEETESYPVQGVIFGYFLRGRYDKPMTITQDNIRGVLGFDFNNPYYRVVQDVLNEGVESVQVVRLMETGERGVDGLSAYQIAVNYGFKGSEAQWLESLKGSNGANGQSAYQIALKNGFNGTEAQWLESLKGAAAAAGLSAYQVAAKNGFVGTEAQWLESLKGVEGPKGADGVGIKGSDGNSAYQVAVRNGFVGTEAQWLTSLKGTNGAAGLSAYQIAVKNGFSGTEAQWLETLGGGGSGDSIGLDTKLAGLDLSIAGNAITANDSLLVALAKLQNQINTFTPHSHNNVIDKGGEGYYPLKQSDGTLYTTSQVITLQPGYYRMAASGQQFRGLDGLYYCFPVNVTRVLTEERLIGSTLLSGSAPDSGSTTTGSVSGWQVECHAAGLEAPSQAGKGGWSETTGSSPKDALKFIFAEAIEINKGPAAKPENPNLKGGYSGNLVISKVLHFLEPVEIRIDIEKLKYNNYPNAFDMTNAGTGFVWIRKVPDPGS